MSNPTDYSVHLTTGTGEIPNLRTVSGQKEERRKGSPRRGRKGRPEHGQPEVELTGLPDDAKTQDGPAGKAEGAAPMDAADAADGDDLPASPTVDYLV